MKSFVFVIALFATFNLWGASCKSDVTKCSGPEKRKICEDAAAQISLNCSARVDSCKYLEGCLERRDTCISDLPAGSSSDQAWVPDSKPKCDTFKSCMADNKGKFNNPYGDCKYDWQPKDKGTKGSCSIHYNMFAYQYTCPGRRDYFDESKGDKSYNCQDVHASYESYNKTCDTLVKKYSHYNACGRFKVFKEAVAETAQDHQCAVAKTFNPKPTKTYAVKSDDSSWMDSVMNFSRVVSNFWNKDDGGAELGPVGGVPSRTE